MYYQIKTKEFGVHSIYMMFENRILAKFIYILYKVKNILRICKAEIWKKVKNNEPQAEKTVFL